MDFVFCQRCLAPNGIDASACSRCGGKLILPSIPGCLDGSLGDFFEEEVMNRIGALERQVRQLAGKLREIVEINQSLAQQLDSRHSSGSPLRGKNKIESVSVKKGKNHG